MKLEVGKKYKNRLGGIAEIVGETGCEIYSYKSSHDYAYTESGKLWWNGTSDYDLIEEYIEPKEEKVLIDLDKVKAEDMKLEVGKKYKNRIGEIVEIVNKTVCEIYCYKSSGGDTYTESGNVWWYCTSGHDLMEEYIEPKEEKATIDLSTMKAEDILIAGEEVALIIDRTIVCSKIAPNRTRFILVLQNGEMCTVDSDCNLLTLKPKKVKYLKPLHVVLSHPSLTTYINDYHGICFNVNGVKLEPSIYHLFDKPLGNLFNRTFAPEWIEEREENAILIGESLRHRVTKTPEPSNGRKRPIL